MQTYKNWHAKEQLLTEAVELLHIDELENILIKAKDGDSEAAKEWPIHVKYFLGSYLNKLGFQAGLNHQEKEDVMQTVLMHLTRNLQGSFGKAMESGNNIKGWLVTILRHAIIDKQRKMIQDKRIVTNKLGSDNEPRSTELEPFDIVDRMEATEKIRNIIASLEPIHQQVLIMYYQKGMKYVDIAQSLRIPEGTVKSRMASAKNKLREKIEAI